MARVISTVRAETASASYDVMIGRGILRTGLEQFTAGFVETAALIVSSRVYELHREYIENSLAPLKGRYRLAVMNDGEEHKSYAEAGRFIEMFLEWGMTRKSLIIAIGGGVVCDFAGFCAGIFMRGIPAFYIPTTLLAMVDASVGGKVAVNISAGKNIAGLFHQPRGVLIDLLFLDTLPDLEFRNGLTEAFKHGLIGDGATLELFSHTNPAEIRNDEVCAGLVERSVIFKSDVVRQDEREDGLRAILNYGHTVGHAIESLTQKRLVPHGEAVTAGIRVANKLSCRMGLLSEDEERHVVSLMDAHGLRHGLKGMDIEGVIRHMEYDKKNFGGAVRFVLLKRIGEPIIGQMVPSAILREGLLEELG